MTSTRSGTDQRRLYHRRRSMFSQLDAKIAQQGKQRDRSPHQLQRMDAADSTNLRCQGRPLPADLDERSNQGDRQMFAVQTTRAFCCRCLAIQKKTGSLCLPQMADTPLIMTAEIHALSVRAIGICRRVCGYHSWRPSPVTTAVGAARF